MEFKSLSSSQGSNKTFAVTGQIIMRDNTRKEPNHLNWSTCMQSFWFVVAKTWTHYLAVSTVIDGTITSSFLMEIYAINDHLTPSQSASVASHVLPFSPPFVRRVVVVSAWAGPACLSHIAANCRCNDFILIRCSHKSSSYQVIDRSIDRPATIDLYVEKGRGGGGGRSLRQVGRYITVWPGEEV